MKLPSIEDSRGNKSQTLLFTVLGLLTMVGMALAPLFLNKPLYSITEFATAFSVILAPWVAREGVDKFVANSSRSEGIFKIPPGA